MKKEWIEAVKKSRSPFKPWDAAILAVVLVLVALTIYFAFRPAGKSVEVYDGGKLVYTADLDTDGEFTIEGKLTVVIKEGKVSVHGASCADKLCEKQGWVNASSASIICLPNNVYVRVTGGELDAIN